MSRRQRILALIATGVVSAATIMASVATDPLCDEVPEIRVGAFNIQVFGQTKLSKPDVMEVLVDTALQFDILLVQEIRDASETTADIFLQEINRFSDCPYAMVEGPRLGRTSSKEQYVIYFLPSRVELVHWYTMDDEDDEFEREPIVATFRSGNFDFTLLGCHIKPSDAENELIALKEAVTAIMRANPDEDDYILMGDFNASGSYLAEGKMADIFKTSTYRIVIEDDVITTTQTENAYDRVVLRNETGEYLEDTAGVFYFDDEFGITDAALIKAVSDHYPILADFDTTDDDDD